ncbi:MAG: PCP reductase family protein [Candidatus Rokubacteria bacterium]|nr:PCP reductase family protein [Candidatus Rokubacteria bacterium]
MDSDALDQRLGALESRLARLEALLQSVSEQLGRTQLNAEASKEAIESWVTDYVSLRLTQLVPETCEHVPDAATAEGPVLPGTRIRCTEEVVHRLGRIPIPFVRQMVTQKVAEAARAEGVKLVDVAFFERAATF